MELDRPDPSRTPKEAGAISKKFLEGLGFTVITAAATSAGTPVSAAPNQLTDAEKRAGWMLLFDGKTLNGWRGYAAGRVQHPLTVADGMLTIAPNDGRTRAARSTRLHRHLRSVRADFEWKVSPGGNSGAAFHPRGHGLGDRARYQIIDDEKHADAAIGPNARPRRSTTSSPRRTGL